MSEEYFASPASHEDIIAKAYAWREALGIGAHRGVVDIVGVLEDTIPQLLPQFTLAIVGKSELPDAEAYTTHEPPTIVVREDVYIAANNFDARSRMTLAHELGHLVLHKTAVPLHRAPEKYRELKTPPTFANTEWQANTFAGAFLCPDWIACTFEDASELAQHCGISPRAASVRLSQTEKMRPRKKLPPSVMNVINSLHE